MSFYLRIGERVEGPFTTGEVQSRLERQVVTLQTPAWQVGWPAWQTVAEALQASAPTGVAPTGPATPPPLPAAAVTTAPTPPPYPNTLLLAGALFGVDGLIGGGGLFSGVVLVFGLPVLLIRALLAWKDAALRRRRFASVGIYAAAALATIALVRFDQAGARDRAEAVITACEDFKKANGAYPRKLEELTPKFLPVIPPARKVGMAKEFIYLVHGTNDFKGEDIHTLIYTATQPMGRRRYHFEEKRWDFFD